MNSNKTKAISLVISFFVLNFFAILFLHFGYFDGYPIFKEVVLNIVFLSLMFTPGVFIIFHIITNR